MKSVLFRALLLAAVLVLCGTGLAAAGGDLFEYVILDDETVMITGYRGSATDLVFPETIDGHNVTGVSRSFGYNTPSVKNLRTVTIPDAVTVIEPGAFLFAGYLTEFRIAESHPTMAFSDGVLYNTKKQSIMLYLQGNTAEHFDVPDGIREIEDKAFIRARLVSVTLPAGMERIGCESFDQCSFLTDVSLPEGLKSIGADAFDNCDRLRRIIIPASVTDIEEAAFTDNRLEEIQVAGGNPVFTVSDGALVNVRDGVLVAWPTQSGAESCVVPEGVTRIGRFAFYRSHHLKQVTLPDGLLEIGRGAFVSCDHLTAVDLPDSVTRLESTAFEGNSDVKQLHISAGLKEIKNNFDGIGVSELDIPETVVSIESSFRTLQNLKEVVIPGGVESLIGNSFAFCKNLSRITIPAGVTDIGCTFIGCDKNLVIIVEPGSTAEQYCKDHQLNCQTISE